MSFDSELTKHQERQLSEYERELDKVQELSDKKEALIDKFTTMFSSIIAENVVLISDLPYDPDDFVEDVKDMILYMWEDYR